MLFTDILGLPERPVAFPIKDVAVIVPVPALILLLFVLMLFTDISGFPVRHCVVYFYRVFS